MLIEKLNRLYEAAENKDDAVTKEMKSNVLLYIGKHYSKIKRDERDSHTKTNEKMKIRLTINHIHRVCNMYINSLISNSMSATIIPQIATELQDKKDAQMSLAVYKDVEYRFKLQDKFEQLAQDFVVHGEPVMKVSYDDSRGEVVGYEKKIVKQKDEYGETIEIEEDDTTKPIMSGDFVFEPINSYNMYVDTGATTPDEAKYVIIKKLVDKDELMKLLEQRYDGDELDEKKALISPKEGDPEEVNIMIDFATGSTVKETNKIFVREYYFKPSIEMPKGKIIIATEKGTLFENELQEDINGKPIFPIIWTRCDTISGTVRGFSKIKQLRPIQIEINRTASKIAETQIMLGDDKVITSYGSSLEEGAKLNGIREFKMRGGNIPIILPGRAGNQFYEYLTMKINDIYAISNVTQDDKPIAQSDIMTNLYSNIRQKKAFSLYQRRFEKFITEIIITIIKMAKAEYTEDKIVLATGAREALNIPEFKSSGDMGYRIHIEPTGADSETVMGKYLQTRDLLQYTGGQLGPDMIGKIAKEGMNFLKGDVFKDLIDENDIIEQIILQLDRGEKSLISPFDNNKKIVDSIVKRMKRPDFQYLVKKNPEIAKVYREDYEERKKIIAQQTKELEDMKNEMLPTGGPMVKVDISMPDKNGKLRKVAIPMNTLEYILDKISKKGVLMEQMPGNEQAQIDVAKTL